MNPQSSHELPILLLRNHPECLSAAAAWFSDKWGIPLEAYQESMEECLAHHMTRKVGDFDSAADTFPAVDSVAVDFPAVPQWYFLRNERQDIIAGCGVIENDFHDRRDLAPNLCALYVEEEYRGQGIAGQLLNYVCQDMAQFGLSTLYLVTDHISFYERYDWTFSTMVKGDDGSMTRLYQRDLSEFK